MPIMSKPDTTALSSNAEDCVTTAQTLGKPRFTSGSRVLEAQRGSHMPKPLRLAALVACSTGSLHMASPMRQYQSLGLVPPAPRPRSSQALAYAIVMAAGLVLGGLVGLLWPPAPGAGAVQFEAASPTLFKPGMAHAPRPMWGSIRPHGHGSARPRLEVVQMHAAQGSAGASDPLFSPAFSGLGVAECSTTGALVRCVEAGVGGGEGGLPTTQSLPASHASVTCVGSPAISAHGASARVMARPGPTGWIKRRHGQAIGWSWGRDRRFDCRRSCCVKRRLQLDLPASLGGCIGALLGAWVGAWRSGHGSEQVGAQEGGWVCIELVEPLLPGASVDALTWGHEEPQRVQGQFKDDDASANGGCAVCVGRRGVLHHFCCQRVCSPQRPFWDGVKLRTFRGFATLFNVWEQPFHNLFSGLG